MRKVQKSRKNKLTYSYSRSCSPPWTFTAVTKRRHSVRAWARFLHRVGSLTPSCRRSFLMQSSQRILGLPKGRRPSGTPSIASRSTLSGGILATYPAQRRRWELTKHVMSGRRDRSRSSWLWRIRHSPVTLSLTGP